MRRLRSITLFLILVLLTVNCEMSTSVFGISQQENWTTFHHDPTLAGFTNDSAPTSVPKLLWSSEYDPNGNFIPSSPVLFNGIAYVANGNLYAFNCSNGEIIWKLNDQGYNSPAIENGVLYTYKGAFNASTGSELWLNREDGMYFAIVANGYYYTCIKNQNANDGATYSLIALNASSGTEIWAAQGYYLVNPPAVSAGVIYFGSGQSVVALDAKTGQKVWDTNITSSIELSTPIADNHVYASAINGVLYCFNALTGTMLWNFTIANKGSYSTPASAYGFVYIGTADGYVYAINGSSGQLVWRFSVSNNESYSVDSSPAIANNVVYICAGNGNLYALDSSSGAKLWSYALGNHQTLQCSPSISNGVIYIGSETNLILALGSTSEIDIVGYVPLIIVIISVILVSGTFLYLRKKKKLN